jgi:hypothetical protein
VVGGLFEEGDLGEAGYECNGELIYFFDGFGWVMLVRVRVS